MRDVAYWIKRVQLAELALAKWEENSSKLIEGNESRGEAVDAVVSEYRKKYPIPVGTDKKKGCSF